MDNAKLPHDKVHHDIKVNKTVIGKLSKCTFYWLNLKPGKYIVSASKESRPARIKIEKGKNIFIRYVPRLVTRKSTIKADPD